MVSVNTTSIVYTPGVSLSQCTTGRKYSDVPEPPAPGVPVNAVTGVTASAVPVPVDVRLHSRSLTGFAVHAPALAPHTAVPPLTCTVQLRLACTVALTVVAVETPVATSMSLIVAVSASGESGEELGDTVSASSAGLTRVPGLSSDTLGEHFPDAPATVQTVTLCALVAAAPHARHAIVQVTNARRATFNVPGVRESFPRPLRRDR